MLFYFANGFLEIFLTGGFSPIGGGCKKRAESGFLLSGELLRDHIEGCFEGFEVAFNYYGQMMDS